MTTEKKARTDNNTYKKLAVQWLNQALRFYQSLCLVDSEVLPCLRDAVRQGNRHLRVALKCK